MMFGKYPSMLDELCKLTFGVIFSCVLVSFVSSIAVRTPRIVTMIAAVFIWVGMVIVCDLVGRMFRKIIIPAITLPHASRLIGLRVFV